MISYTWCSELTGDDLDEVLDLVRVAAEYDEEAGFSEVDPADIRQLSREGLRVIHLPIRARRGLSPLSDAPTVVVAYLRIGVNGERLGTVDYVVHPEYRSRGITTLLVEEIGLGVNASEGWAGTGATALRCWAYATHPAAERLTKRFGIPAAARQWTEARHLTGPYALPLSNVALPAGIELTPARAATYPDPALTQVLDGSGISTQNRERLITDLRRGHGQVIGARDGSGDTVGFVWFSTDTRAYLELRAASIHALILQTSAGHRGVGSALTTLAMREQAKAGVQVSLLRIDPDDAGAVRMSRLLGFEQDESHSCYQVGETTVPVPAFE